MQNLIPRNHHGIMTVSLKRLADAVNLQDEKGRDQIRLPSFQRDSVWDATRIEVFWDSVLRRFPIGTLLMVPHGSIDPSEHGPAFGRKARSLTAASPKSRVVDARSPGSGGLLLVDGQQRTLAIALGFRDYQPGDDQRLWLDLSAISEDGGSSSPTVTRFGFRLTTRAQPWGEGSTVSQRRDAAELCGKSLAEIDHDEQSLSYTWPTGPANKVFPVPFHELRTYHGAQRPWEREALVEFAPEPLRNFLPEIPVEQLEQVRRALEGLAEREVPVDVIRKPSPWTAEELHLLFQRVNTQGMEMSGDELFFSGIKLHWPESHELVWEIHEKVGRLLKPTRVVHLATRLSVHDPSELTPKDVPRLNLGAFKRLLDENDPEQEEGFLVKLQGVLGDSEGSACGLGETLHRAKDLLRYRGGDDPGFPVPLLARLDWRVWHTLVGWLDIAKGGPAVHESSRGEILRYAAMQRFFVEVSRSQSITTRPMQLVRKSPEAFNGRAIYEAFLKADPTWLRMESIALPDEYRRAIGIPEDAEWSGHVLKNESDLLLWAQRRWVQDWFEGYDPTQLLHADYRPYDIDHILPRSHFDRRGRKDDLPDQFYLAKKRIGNAVGNLRIWPKSSNRADGSRGLAAKGLLGEAPADVSDHHPWLSEPPLGFRTYGEVRKASLMEEGQLPDWRRADPLDGDAKRWTEDRLAAMAKVVLARRERIYTRFFEGLGFAEWGESSGESA